MKTPKELSQMEAAFSKLVPIMSSIGVDKKNAITELQGKYNAICQTPVKILVCGEFKRGKSSFINALLGRNICAVDQDICTSAVSVLRYSEKETVTRYFGELSSPKKEVINISDLDKYTVGTAEEVQNTLYLEVGIPNEKLKAGIVLIDTPGVGGLDPRHAMLTSYFMPQADIALFMTDVNEPLTTTELDFYKNRIVKFSTHNAIILNKCDLKDSSSVEQLRKDTASKIARYCNTVSPVKVVPVSSRKKLLFEKTKNEKLLQDSNFDDVEKMIWSLASSYQTAAMIGICSGVEKMIDDVLVPLNEKLQQIQMPDKNRISELREKQSILQEQLTSLKDPNSLFRQQVQRKINLKHEEVITALTENSIIFSSQGFEELLKNQKINEEGGVEWIQTQINDAMAAMSSNIVVELRNAFNEIEQMPEFGNLLNYSIKDIDLSVQATDVKTEVSFGQRFSDIRVAGSAGGLAGTIVGGISLLLLSAPAAAVVGALAGVCAMIGIGIDNTVTTNTKAKAMALRQQFQPQINVAMQKLRTYVEMRFNEFQQEWIRIATKRLNDCSQDLQKLITEINQLMGDEKKAIAAQMSFQRIVEPLKEQKQQIVSIADELKRQMI